MKRQKPKRQHKRLFTTLGIVALIVVVGGVSGVVLHLRHVHDAQKRSGAVATVTTPKTTPSSGDKSSGGTSTTSTTTGTSDKDSGTSTNTGSSSSSSTSTTTTAALIAPYGTFVSNHRPGQNGSPTTEQSVCTTTPGATCNITFTNSAGVVKSLGAQTVGSDGTASWNWNVTGSDLAAGSWKVAATATLNGQSKATADATTLEIQ
jgi:hypothetical protein